MDGTSIYAGGHYKEYTQAASLPVNLVAEGQAGGSSDGYCRQIECISGSGTITGTNRKGASVTRTLVAGQVWSIQLSAITAVTGAAFNIGVTW